MLYYAQYKLVVSMIHVLFLFFVEIANEVKTVEDRDHLLLLFNLLLQAELL